MRRLTGLCCCFSLYFWGSLITGRLRETAAGHGAEDREPLPRLLCHVLTRDSGDQRAHVCGRANAALG